MSIPRSMMLVVTVSALVMGFQSGVSGAEMRTPPHRPVVRRAAAQEPVPSSVLRGGTTVRTAVPSSGMMVEEGPLLASPEIVGEPVMMPELAGGEFFPGVGPVVGDACCDPCFIPRQRWVSLEYLMWWRRGQPLPPLVTSSPAGTPQDEAGVLGFEDTRILLGGDTVGEVARPGGRITLGVGLDPFGCHSIEGRYYALGETAITYTRTSDGTPILARPFFDQETSAAASLLVAYPGFTTNGVVQAQGTSDVLGGDVLYRWTVSRLPTSTMSLVGGYQFARIDESLVIGHRTVAVDIPLVDPGTTFEVRDSFATRNEFQGGSIGLSWQHLGCGWNVEVLAKVGLGNMHQVVNIAGQTVVTTPAPDSTVDTEAAGLLARGANLGQHTRSEFAVAPEIGVNCQYQLSQCLVVNLGYSFLYWSNVALPGAQIDPQLRVPTPSYTIRDNSYSLHGLNVGAEFRF